FPPTPTISYKRDANTGFFFYLSKIKMDHANADGVGQQSCAEFIKDIIEGIDVFTQEVEIIQQTPSPTDQILYGSAFNPN
ncbi:8498_t:CDS:1, partial [Racocetra persica]